MADCDGWIAANIVVVSPFSNCSFRSAVIKRLFSMQAIRPPFYLSLVSTIYIQLQHSYTHSKIPHNLLFPAYCDRSLDMVNEFFKQNLLYFRHFELEKKQKSQSCLMCDFSFEVPLSIVLQPQGSCPLSILADQYSSFHCETRPRMAQCRRKLNCC